MPKSNKSVIVVNNSTHVASPLTMADISNFAKLIADIIYESPYYDREAHIFDVEFDDYTAEVEYLIEYKRVLVTESQGIKLYDFEKVGESIEVLNVKHYDGTLHPVLRYALNRILK